MSNISGAASGQGWGKKFIEREPYKMNVMPYRDLRDRMIEHRRAMSDALTSDKLVEEVTRFFDHNSTMPGEKVSRVLVEKFGRLFKEDKQNKLMDECYERGGKKTTFREDLLDEFAHICIKEARMSEHDLKAIAREGAFGMMAGEEYNRSFYEVPVTIGKDGYVYGDSGKTRCLGRIADGFLTNHNYYTRGEGQEGQNTMDGMAAHLMVVDHAGRYLQDGHNCAFYILIDLGQHPWAAEMALEVPKSEVRIDPDKVATIARKQPCRQSCFADEEFEEAVVGIPVPAGLVM